MRRLLQLITFTCAALSFISFTRAQGWRGIKPLHSTRVDVQRLIGSPTEPNGLTYDLKTERVTIFYSGSPCVEGWPYGWNVPPDTVISIAVYPQTKITLTDLRIDLSKFKKSNHPQINGALSYENYKEGVGIRTRQDGEAVEVIDYFPAAKDKHLLCPDAAARESEIARGEATYLQPILYYFNVSSSEENTRLQYFADQLRKFPHGSQAYIIGYAGRRACPNEALTRANRAKNYLTNKLRVAAARIITIDGGHRDDIWVQLHIVPPNGPKPLASPGIHPRDVEIVKCDSNKTK